MKNSVPNLLPKRPSDGALFSLLVVMLMGSSSSWAANERHGANAQGECEFTDQKQAMLSSINEARRKPRQCGDQDFEAAEPLTWSCKLEAAAQMHSQDMAENDYFSHTDPDGEGIEQRVSSQDYNWQAVGENIAAGHSSVPAVVNGWLESPGHCQNIMSAAFTEMGMAKVNGPDSRYSTYWTQTLGNPR
nr:CAP domain-containing protein [Halomonas neptunia]